MDLIWRNRYSDSNLPDKHGRWSRLCFYNGLLIAWISMVESIYHGKYYCVKDFFPSTGNDIPQFSGVEKDFEIAKKGVEERFNKFIEKIITNENRIT